MIDENTVLIGNKPIMKYVLAVITQFNNGAKTVTIKARGNAISRAVDVLEVSKNKFVKNIKVQNISTSTEKINTDRGESNVSTIEIVLEI